MQEWAKNLEATLQILRDILPERIYNDKTHQFPAVQRLLLERYYFQLPEDVAAKLPDNMKELHTLRVEWKRDPTNGLEFEVYVFDAGGSVIYTESFEAMARRVAKRIASGLLKIDTIAKNSPLHRFVKNQPSKTLELINKLAQLFEFAIYHKFWLPSSPFLMNAGRGAIGNSELLYKLYKPYSEMTLEDYEAISQIKDPAYGSCYAMGTIEDDIRSIFEMLYKQAEVFRHAGGFGVNFSKLRSKYADVSTIKGKSSGPLMFMRLFNEVTYIIALHARTKRGANMFLMDVRHPEIKDFINLKTDFDKGYQNIQYANISMALDEEFIKALWNGTDWLLVDPHDASIQFKVDPRELWANAVFNATLHAEPGILNLYAINKDNPIYDVEPITSVNPCGEFTGFDGSVCVLGSVNLYSLLIKKDNKITFHFPALAAAVKSLHLFLTLAAAANEYPLPELTEKTRKYRNTGVGYMGLASTLLMLKKRYGSKEAFDFFKRVMRTFSHAVVRSSIELAKLIGPHAHYDKNRFVKTGSELNEMFHTDKFKPDKRYYVWNTSNPDAVIQLEPGEAIANARLMAIAPTGSISFICQVSSGVEPIFQLAYERRINPDMPSEYSVLVYDSAIADYAKHYAGVRSTEVKKWIEQLMNSDVQLPEYVVTTNDVGVVEKIAMLSVSNRYIDMNTSSTFNLRRDTVLRDVSELLHFDDNLLEEAYFAFQKKKFDIQTYLEKLLQDKHHFEAFRHFLLGDPAITPQEKATIEHATALEEIAHTKTFERGWKLIEAVHNFYLLALLLNMKGTTIYVENTRRPILVAKSNNRKLGNHMTFSIKESIFSHPKGYKINSHGKAICPVCGGELEMKEGCAECPKCGWAACT